MSAEAEAEEDDKRNADDSRLFFSSSRPRCQSSCRSFVAGDTFSRLPSSEQRAQSFSILFPAWTERAGMNQRLQSLASAYYPPPAHLNSDFPNAFAGRRSEWSRNSGIETFHLSARLQLSQWLRGAEHRSLSFHDFGISIPFDGTMACKAIITELFIPQCLRSPARPFPFSFLSTSSLCAVAALCDIVTQSNPLEIGLSHFHYSVECGFASRSLSGRLACTHAAHVDDGHSKRRFFPVRLSLG